MKNRKIIIMHVKYLYYPRFRFAINNSLIYVQHAAHRSKSVNLNIWTIVFTWASRFVWEPALINHFVLHTPTIWIQIYSRIIPRNSQSNLPSFHSPFKQSPYPIFIYIFIYLFIFIYYIYLYFPDFKSHHVTILTPKSSCRSTKHYWKKKDSTSSLIIVNSLEETCSSSTSSMNNETFTDLLSTSQPFLPPWKLLKT